MYICRTSERNGPFDLDAVSDLTALQCVLEQAGFREKQLTQALRPALSASGLDLNLLEHGLSDDIPFNVLLRLFILGQAVDQGLVNATLGNDVRQQLLNAGLLENLTGECMSRVCLMPTHGFWLFQDFTPQWSRRMRTSDHVMGYSSGSHTLRQLTVRQRGERVFDLGVGGGIHALHAAHHASSVIGGDISVRALQMAALSLRLNGIDNVELRLGNLYEPVRDAAFDLIVSQPPFAISPETSFDYRDGHLDGDAFCAQMVGQGPALLADNGWATLLCHWFQQPCQTWDARPCAWLAPDAGCDAWIVGLDRFEPRQYARFWLREGVGGQAEVEAEQLKTWLDYYQGLDVEHLYNGAIILHKRRGVNWVRSDLLMEHEQHPSSWSAQIQRIFQVETLMRDAPDRSLWSDRAYKFVAAHHLKNNLRVRDGAWFVHEAVLDQTEGYPFRCEVDPLTCEMLAHCDGQTRLSKIAAALGQHRGQDPATLLARMELLLRQGFLKPAEG